MSTVEEKLDDYRLDESLYDFRNGLKAISAAKESLKRDDLDAFRDHLNSANRLFSLAVKNLDDDD